jgi:hypothetical protein
MEFGPVHKLPGGGLGEDATKLFEKPTTFYVVKIEVPLKDGTTTSVYKAGVCVGKVLGGRYPKNAPIEVWIEIGNLHRSIARTLEGKILLIMRRVPWKDCLYTKEKRISEPDMSISFEERYGPSEWGSWYGSREELAETVNEVLRITKEHFVPKLSVPESNNGLYWQWAKSKWRPNQ